MKNVILKQATIFDTESAFHGKKKDITIKDGIIHSIDDNASNVDNFEEIQLENLHVSQGWFDASVSFGEPGFEDRETISNGLKVAAKSGFTAIALQPNSFPVIDNQSQVAFVLEKSKNQATTLLPIGALTKNSEGKDMAELFDMKNAGAIAFGDYNKYIENANIQKIALQYVQDFDGLLIAFCEDTTIKGKGIAHEGIVTTELGLKGIPTLAEEIAVARNLFLLEYTDGKMHIPTISSSKSVELIAAAKKKGLQVTCSVSVHHLALTDECLRNFDANYKVSPPLVNDENRKTLLEAVKNGTIDCITSDHNPIDIEHKNLEFDLAKDGTIGLESAFGMLGTLLPLEKIIEKLTAAKTVFGLPKSVIEVGNMAQLSLFNPTAEWTFGKENILSKSKNSAFLGQNLKGKAYGIYNNGKLEL